MIIIMFVGFYIIMLTAASSVVRGNVYDGVRQTMQLYSKEVEENLHMARSVMILNVLNDKDLNEMCFTTDPSTLALDQAKAQTLLKTLLPGLTNTDGIFIYAPETDSYIAEGRVGNKRCRDYILRIMREDGPTELNTDNKWILRLLDGKYYLVNIMDMVYCYAGAWVQLDTLNSSFASLDTDAIFLYTDSAGRAIGRPIKEKEGEKRLDPLAALEKPVTVFYGGEEYLQISEDLSFCDYYLIALIPTRDVYNPLRRLSQFMLVGAMVLLLAAFINLQLPRYFLMKPVRTIRETAAKLSAKEYAVQLPVDDREYEELQELNTAINRLLADATSLQQQVYEETIQRKEFELQYLKSQVAPHFLINCFSAIGAIPDTEEGRKTRSEMIRTLSEHLRYVLGERQYVPMNEELYYVENYLALSALRFPDCLRYEIIASDEVRQARVFPLLVLMLTENAIKHNLIMGEEFSIRITCSIEPVTEEMRALQTADNRFDQVVHIVHTDSGTGYTEEILQIFNHIVEKGRARAEDGHHLGLYNNIKRSEIMLDHHLPNGGFSFRNCPEGGAHCDIYVPYRRYEE